MWDYFHFYVKAELWNSCLPLRLRLMREKIQSCGNRLILFRKCWKASKSTGLWWFQSWVFQRRLLSLWKNTFSLPTSRDCLAKLAICYFTALIIEIVTRILCVYEVHSWSTDTLDSVPTLCAFFVSGYLTEWKALVLLHKGAYRLRRQQMCSKLEVFAEKNKSWAQGSWSADCNRAEVERQELEINFQ